MIVTDRYKIPKDTVDIYREIYGDNTEALCSGIIEFAREKTRIYAMPATWICELLKDGTAIVKRKRKATPKPKISIKEFAHV
jgi:hypothetical protein